MLILRAKKHSNVLHIHLSVCLDFLWIILPIFDIKKATVVLYTLILHLFWKIIKIHAERA